ncbi:hypothetical protein BH10BAC1_BH10BAC1_12610 [soil metagenome]
MTKIHISICLIMTYFAIFVKVKHFCKILFLFFLISFASCKKYEDGPAFSLMSKKARISNLWKVDTYYLNGQDKTTQYRQLITREKLVIYESGNFEYSELSSWLWGIPNYTGTWKFVNDKEDFEMASDNPQAGTKTYKILRLKNRQLWLQERISSDSLVEYHYLPETQ